MNNEMIMSGINSEMSAKAFEIMNDGGMAETSASTLENVLSSSPSYIASQYYKKTPQQVREHKKIGRNDPCPCGSGKKYKNCCLSSGKYEGLRDA